MWTCLGFLYDHFSVVRDRRYDGIVAESGIKGADTPGLQVASDLIAASLSGARNRARSETASVLAATESSTFVPVPLRLDRDRLFFSLFFSSRYGSQAGVARTRLVLLLYSALVPVLLECLTPVALRPVPRVWWALALHGFCNRHCGALRTKEFASFVGSLFRVNAFHAAVSLLFPCLAISHLPPTFKYPPCSCSLLPILCSSLLSVLAAGPPDLLIS